jgi:hypothetical protein
MLDYIVADLSPLLTPSGLIFTAAELSTTLRLQSTLSQPQFGHECGCDSCIKIIRICVALKTEIRAKEHTWGEGLYRIKLKSPALCRL